MVSSSDPRVRALARNVRGELRDPWVILTSVLGGGAAWAVGIPVPEAGLVGALMLGTGATLAALSGRRAPAAQARLHGRTEQSQAVAALDGYLGDLRQLEQTALPDEVKSSAIEALVAADGARLAAFKVAQAIDALDAALVRGREVAASRSTDGARSAVLRMETRRQTLLGKLNSNVDEVAEVYTRLLELSATVGTMGLGENGAAAVEAVNVSMESLSQAFSELAGELTRDPNDIVNLAATSPAELDRSSSRPAPEPAPEPSAEPAGEQREARRNARRRRGERGKS